MATSGTISQTSFDTRRVIDQAFLRCKLPPQSITAERIQFALDSLYLMLSDLPNRGVQLWTVDRQILGMRQGQGVLQTPVGTIDLLQANLRTTPRLGGTETTTATTRQIRFDSPTVVGTVGLLWTAALATGSILIESSADGSAWTTVATISGPAGAPGRRDWYDPSDFAPQPFWRLSGASLPVSDVYWGGAPNEIPMARLNRDDFENLPNKTFAGRPLQYWLDRQVDVPLIRLWPVPDLAASFNQVVIRRRRHIMDVGTMQQTLEIPQRWFATVVALLADELAQQLPEVDAATAQMVAARAAEARAAAQYAEQDSSPIKLAAAIGAYTR